MELAIRCWEFEEAKSQQLDRQYVGRVLGLLARNGMLRKLVQATRREEVRQIGGARTLRRGRRS